MSIQPERVVVEAEGLTISRIIWRRFRRPMYGLHERVLDLNPGLAEAGVILPLGTVFLLPVDPVEAVREPEKLISLWS